jgi:hypothetical protein
MNVSDESKILIIRQKLLEAERRLHEANKIIANLGVYDGDTIVDMAISLPDCDIGPDPVTRLYPGQRPNIEHLADIEECDT